jgi:hypothetical protein
LVVLPLPIILSNDLAPTFEHTKANTGFFRWIQNNPEILLELSERINESSEFLNPAIEFAVYRKIIQITNLGTLLAVQENISTAKSQGLSDLFKRANKLGNWMGQVNSSKTIFNYLGIQV